MPLIEQSKAFRDGGLIDVTFDEGFPPFTYSGNSFNNAATSGSGQPADAPTFGATGSTAPGADSLYGAYGILSDAASENINGKNVNTEPTGPNSTLSTNAAGDQLTIPALGTTSSSTDLRPVNRHLQRSRLQIAFKESCSVAPVRRRRRELTRAATGNASSNIIQDNTIVSDDTGRQVSGTNIPANAFVGAVTDSGPLFPTVKYGSSTVGSFQLVDQSGTPLTPTGPVSGITLSAEGAPGYLTTGQTPDPLYDAIDPTPGGGDTGSVLISKYIKPGTVSSTYYNHYSWLATMEDIFNVSAGHSHKRLSPGAGTISGGLDGKGHLGYAAQAGLQPFGKDIFTWASKSLPKAPKIACCSGRRHQRCLQRPTPDRSHCHSTMTSRQVDISPGRRAAFTQIS